MPWTAAAPCELLKLSDMADALHRGVLLILVRLGVAYGLCALFYALFGYEGFLGISFLAFVCAVTSANAALYMGIISPFGDKADKASFGIMLICSMPLLFLGFYGEAGFGEAQADHLSDHPLHPGHGAGQHGYGYPQGVCRRQRHYSPLPGL